MNANLPEILPSDLDAARRFLFADREEARPAAVAPARTRPRPQQGSTVVRNGISRARSRPATTSGDA